MALTKVQYQINVERFFSFRDSDTDEEREWDVLNHITEQLAGCKLGHKVESRVVSGTGKITGVQK